MDKEEIKIPYNEEISLKISGAFYYRLRTVFITLMEQRSPEEMFEMLKRIQGEETDDPSSYSLETMLILLRSIEKQFIDEKKTEVIQPPVDQDSTQD